MSALREKIEKFHTDEEHGEFRCIGFSEVQACCFDEIRAELLTLVDAAREIEKRFPPITSNPQSLALRKALGLPNPHFNDF